MIFINFTLLLKAIVVVGTLQLKKVVKFTLVTWTLSLMKDQHFQIFFQVIYFLGDERLRVEGKLKKYGKNQTLQNNNNRFVSKQLLNSQKFRINFVKEILEITLKLVILIVLLLFLLVSSHAIQILNQYETLYFPFWI